MTSADADAGGHHVRSFIVRLWRRPEGFSAEVRPLSGGENRTFTRLRELFAYLEAEAAGGAGASDERR